MNQSSHKMYSNNMLNFQESTTLLNAYTKKVWNLIEGITYIYIYIYICVIKIIFYFDICLYFLDTSNIFYLPNVLCFSQHQNYRNVYKNQLLNYIHMYIYIQVKLYSIFIFAYICVYVYECIYTCLFVYSSHINSQSKHNRDSTERQHVFRD